MPPASPRTTARSADWTGSRRCWPGPRDDIGEAAPLMAALMGLDGTRRYGALTLTPQQRRNRTLAVLIDQLTGLASRKPVLWVIEDAHWIDPTTLELIELALDRVQGARVLVLITARPTFVASFGSHPVVTRLALNRLGARRDPGDRRAHHPRQAPAGAAARRDRRADRRRAAVRRGDDQGGHRIGRAARERRRLSPRRPAERAGDPHDAARLADGAARSAAAGQGGGADRRGHRPQLRPSHHRRPRRPARRRARRCDAPAGRGRADLSPRHAAGRDLSVQARPGPRCRLREPAQGQAHHPACPSARRAGEPAATRRPR